MDKKENSTGKLKSSKRKIRVILGIVIIIIVILIAVIIHLVSPKVKSEITADGMLGYIISALSAIVTGILAIYAITQTDKANEMTKQANEIAMKANDIADKSIEMTKQANEIAMKANDIAKRALDIEANDYEIKYSPFFVVSSYELCYKNEHGNAIYNSSIKINEKSSCSFFIILSITNTTDSTFLFSYKECESEVLNLPRIVDNQCEKNTLSPAETKTIGIISDGYILLNKRARLTFSLENSFAQRYEESFDIFFIENDKTQNKDNYWFNVKDKLYFDNYELKRIEKDGKEREIKIR